MEIRALKLEDLNELEKIHKDYFSADFPLPDFLDHFLGAFVVLDDSGEIITAGGVRTIVESVILTNKSIDIRDRRLALMNLMQASMFTAARFNFNQIHAVIHDEKWKRHLTKVGFQPCNGEFLYLNL